MKKSIVATSFLLLTLLSACSEENEKDENQNSKSSSSETAVAAKTTENISSVSITPLNIVKESDDMIELDIVLPQFNGMADEEQQTSLNNYFADLGHVFEEETRSTALLLLEGREEYPYSSQAVGTMDYEIKKLDNELISLVLRQYKFEGGAHGLQINSTFNYDVRTNKQLTLSDLFEGDEHIALLSEITKKQLSTEGMFFKDRFTQIEENEEFYFQDDNLVLLFNQLKYTASAAGSPEVVIPKSELPTLKKEYQ